MTTRQPRCLTTVCTCDSSPYKDNKHYKQNLLILILLAQAMGGAVMTSLVAEYEIMSSLLYHFRNEQQCGRFFYLVPRNMRTSNALFAGSQAPPFNSSHTTNMNVEMITEHWWNDTDKGKLKFWDRNRSQCHLVQHKSHTDCTDNELGAPRSISSHNHDMGLSEMNLV